MKTITLKNITKSYDNRTLFEDVSFTLAKGDRIAVTGLNGVGKSTLLKIITGLETFDSGKLVKQNVTCEYIPQEFSGNSDLTVLEYFDSIQAPPAVFDCIKKFKVLSEAQIENSVLSELSGGQKRVVEIVGKLAKSPMFLCIDEPENHLDIKARMVLVGLLKHYWGAVLFVSHDRHLVNEISNKILALKTQESVLMSGKSYEEFFEAEARQNQGDLARWKAESREITKMEDNVRMLKARTRYGDSQAKTYQMKKRQLEERQQAHGQRPDLQKQVKIEVSDVKRKTGKLIFGCNRVDFAYADNLPVLQELDIELRFGDRVVLLGRNGSGKTTFLNLLKQQIRPQTGTVRIGTDVAIQYFDQTNTLDPEASALEHFRERGFEEEEARSILSQFQFDQSEVNVAIKVLSGGQQQRLTFLLMFKTSPECVVMDEPTNNLDSDTWNLLLRLVNEFTGTLLLISHDRSFIERLIKVRTWVLQDRNIKESWADLDTTLLGL